MINFQLVYINAWVIANNHKMFLRHMMPTLNAIGVVCGFDFNEINKPKIIYNKFINFLLLV